MQLGADFFYDFDDAPSFDEQLARSLQVEEAMAEDEGNDEQPLASIIETARMRQRVAMFLRGGCRRPLLPRPRCTQTPP